MSSSALVRVYYEGHEERAVLTVLQEADRLPGKEQLEIVEEMPQGTEGLLEGLVDFLGLLGTKAIALRDWDDLNLEGMKDWLHTGLTNKFSDRKIETSVVEDRFVRADVERGGIVLVVQVGLPEDDLIAGYNITKFALDDYLIRMAMCQSVYENTSQLSKPVNYCHTKQKLADMVDLMRHNEIEIKQSKRLLQMLMGITGFRPSPATFAERLTEATLNCPDEGNLLQPLLGDMVAATKLLQAL